MSAPQYTISKNQSKFDKNIGHHKEILLSSFRYTSRLLRSPTRDLQDSLFIWVTAESAHSTHCDVYFTLALTRTFRLKLLLSVSTSVGGYQFCFPPVCISFFFVSVCLPAFQSVSLSVFLSVSLSGCLCLFL